MRVHFVGMNNPYGADPRHALYPWPPTSAGGRLYGMVSEAIGWTRGQYVDGIDRLNLVEGPWSAASARDRASELLDELWGRRVVMLGGAVAEAFRLRAHPILQWRDGWFAVLPHPSGRNRWYNEASNRAAAVAFLRETLS